MMNATEAINKLEDGPKKLFYNTAEAADILGLKVTTLRYYRAVGKGPEYVHTSTGRSLCLYPYDGLVRWAESLKTKGWK